jgi:recombination protein RecT
MIEEIKNRIDKLVKEKKIEIDSSYNYQNAIQEAFIEIGKLKNKKQESALDVCSKKSISTAILQMIMQGLDPANKEVYFQIQQKKEQSILTFKRSYFGTIKLLKRRTDVKQIFTEVVYKKDKFDEYTIINGRKTIKHRQRAENIINTIDNIEAVYVVISFKVTNKDNPKDDIIEIMPMSQIIYSWEQYSSSYQYAKKEGMESPHTKYPDQMAKRTVLERVAKTLLPSIHESNPIENDAYFMDANTETFDFQDEPKQEKEKQSEAETELKLVEVEEKQQAEQKSEKNITQSIKKGNVCPF